ncbi:tRNA-His guanylyltransferase [Xylographa opegraphella]|nr:tRNA-His guanylyltransferase [Xylographa opegraphella]
MANSKYEYVKTFEKSDNLLPLTYIVVRIDGRGFHKLSSKYGFEKPNDRRALDLMNAAATGVLKELPDICFAYGISDEFSFVFDKTCTLFDRRESKIVTTIVSSFTSYYTHLWSLYFSTKPLSPPLPSFDGRAVLYPAERPLRDYICWRQVDCHINNLYNTTFWALVAKGGIPKTQAEDKLKGTVAADKNEILFKNYGINYNEEPEIFKKGSFVYRSFDVLDTPSTRDVSDECGPVLSSPASRIQQEKEKRKGDKMSILVDHLDLIKDDFWHRRPWLLSGRPR